MSIGGMIVKEEEALVDNESYLDQLARVKAAKAQGLNANAILKEAQTGGTAVATPPTAATATATATAEYAWSASATAPPPAAAAPPMPMTAPPQTAAAASGGQVRG